MAEGPQARLRASWLHRHLSGRAASVLGHRSELGSLAAELDGLVVARVFAAGKQIWFELADGRWLFHHLRMDGRWRRVAAGEALPEGAWLEWRLEGESVVNVGGEVFELLEAEEAAERRAALGPDVLEEPLPEAEMAAALGSSRRAIGDLLLDQAVISGVGNIAKSEALLAAGVDPRIPGDALELRERVRLVRALGAVCRESLANGGRWAKRVYRRAGQACPGCGEALLALEQGRRTDWCARCQGGRAPVDGQRAGRLFRGLALWGHAGWSGRLFPPGTAATGRLGHYAARVTAVEGNTIFYALPNAETVQRWSEAMPEGFRFLTKLPKTITHEGLLLPQMKQVPGLLDRLAPLGQRLGPAFAQLPEHYGPERLRDLEAFLRAWPHERQALTLEVRHGDWFAGEARERLVRLMAETGTGRVVLDTRAVHGPGHKDSESAACRKPFLPLDLASTSPNTVVRFIGSADPERNRPLLAEWAARTDRLLRTGRDVYWFGHCPDEDRSPGVLLDFEAQLAARRAPAEPLPWDGSPAKAPQGELFS